MKIGDMVGEFGFKALFRVKGTGEWRLTNDYFFSEEDVKIRIKMIVVDPETPLEYMFPVTINDDGSVYIPEKGEYQ